MILTLGPYKADTKTYRVSRSDQLLKWGDKASQLFVLLLENSPQTISKETIFAQVWQGRVVTENSLYKTIGTLRKTLNKDGIEIESVFGEGYRIIADDSMDSVQSIEFTQKNKKTSKLKYLPLLLLIPLIWFSHDYQKATLLFGKMKRLQQNLAVTKQAFISQVNVRNELGELLSQRFELNPEDSWEKRFYQLYDQMNAQERFLCQQTRAYTEGPLYEKNQAALSLLNNHPELSLELPMAQELITHLTIWLNKYHRVFKGSEKMCLLYVGVEDGAKYPSEFDAQLAAWINQHQ
ncbi:winged helix-turn-helix domain-containing protein [Marinicella litoralis]|uniref:DNA-binding winged helix-turn-helix (WHTH) protein n=1 Tax=Marinicella litoralis TaxID=644220 RepID=A0A4R6XTJ4_9GAMM|nr:winged helix-turn-helix domain-containing protein [Marinicella litoralis]TDR23285.1 DNA-binding winged helix-turn-helix (wHTH) protein [Marinicella litoralis]